MPPARCRGSAANQTPPGEGIRTGAKSGGGITGGADPSLLNLDVQIVGAAGHREIDLGSIGLDEQERVNCRSVSRRGGQLDDGRWSWLVNELAYSSGEPPESAKANWLVLPVQIGR